MQTMSKSNPVGRSVNNPYVAMEATEYLRRRMSLFETPLADIVPKYNEKKLFINYFMPRLIDVDHTNEKFNFDNTTFYHFNAPDDIEEKEYPLDTLTRLPFDDIALVLHGGMLTPDDRPVIKFKIKSANVFVIGLYLINAEGFYCSPITTEYNLVEEENRQIINEAYLKHLPLHNRNDLLKAFASYAIATIHYFLDMYEAYEPVLVDNDLPKTIHRPNGTATEQPTASRSEFVFDLNKPRPKNVRDSTGTHARPCEHIRRPHKRTLRNGKVIWVAQKIINKGVGKSVKKEYKL